MRLDDLVQEVRRVGHDAAAGVLAPGWLPFAVTSERFVLELVSRLGDGGFHDPAWVRALLIDADRRFLDAVRAPALRPLPWQLAARAIEQDARPALRNLLLGIACHIMYDLVVTVAPVVRADDPSQRRDFARINDIISRVVDGVQAEIRAAGPPWLTWADAGLSRTDELATWLMFRVTRARAFDAGIALARGDRSESEVAREAARIVTGLTLLPL